MHSHEPYNHFSGYPNADFIYDHHLRLPIHNEMTKEQAIYVNESILEFLENTKSYAKKP